jgi:hypothetical protein
VLVNNQTAQALFRNPSLTDLEPRLELKLTMGRSVLEQSRMAEPRVRNEETIMFSAGPTSRVLCRCGAVAEMDRTVVGTKRGLGKTVECRRCRNLRIAREREELDHEFNGMLENEER